MRCSEPPGFQLATCRTLHPVHARKRRLQSRFAQFMCGSAAALAQCAHSAAAGSSPACAAAPAPVPASAWCGDQVVAFAHRPLQLENSRGYSRLTPKSSQARQPMHLALGGSVTWPYIRHMKVFGSDRQLAPRERPASERGDQKAEQHRGMQRDATQGGQCQRLPQQRAAHRAGPQPGGCQTQTGCRATAGPALPRARRLPRAPRPASAGTRGRRPLGYTGY